MSWGKPRTKLGEWMHNRKVSNEWLRLKTGVNKNTITNVTTKDICPHEKTKKKIIKALREIDPHVKASDFWDV